MFYFDSLGAPEHRSDRYFFAHRCKDQEKATVHWRQGEHASRLRMSSSPHLPLVICDHLATTKVRW